MKRDAPKAVGAYSHGPRRNTGRDRKRMCTHNKLGNVIQFNSTFKREKQLVRARKSREGLAKYINTGTLTQGVMTWETFTRWPTYLPKCTQGRRQKAPRCYSLTLEKIRERGKESGRKMMRMAKSCFGRLKMIRCRLHMQ